MVEGKGKQFRGQKHAPSQPPCSSPSFSQHSKQTASGGESECMSMSRHSPAWLNVQCQQRRDRKPELQKHKRGGSGKEDTGRERAVGKCKIKCKQTQCLMLCWEQLRNTELLSSRGEGAVGGSEFMGVYV